MDYREQFRDAIAAVGLTPPDTIVDDGELHRFASNGERGDDAGYYVYHGNGVPAGGFGCWRAGIKEAWRADIGRKISPHEAIAQSERIADAKRKREAEETRRHAETRERATQLWERAKPADAAHPYLTAKTVRAHGIRQDGETLLVPMRAAGELHSLQTIAADGNKRFLSGGRVAGCYHSIGKPDGVLCIAEGYATAASVHEATGHPVAVAFNAGNLSAVARALREKMPDVRIIVCADDDYRTDGNPGMTKASAAARAVGGLVAIPDFGDDRPEGATDFNDLAQHAGAAAVQRAVASARAPEVSEPQGDARDALAADPARQEVHLLRGDQVMVRPVAWLWPDFLARGKVHIIAGAPGTGKTTLAMAFAATMTQAGRWPDGSRAAVGDVLIWSGEDSAGDTLAPRLLASGANMARIHFVEHVVTTGSPVLPFDPARHFPALKSAAARLPELALMIVDPIVSAVAGDSHHNAEVRRGLAPLVEFAESLDCALVGISHFAKGTQGKEPLERIVGSLGFGAVARIAFGTAKLPEAEGGGRVLVRVKSNLGPDGGGFRYTVSAQELSGKHAGVKTTRVEWGEPIEGSARDILAQAEVGDGHEAGSPKEYLQGLLADGPLPAADLFKDARANGFSKQQMYRAKAALGVEARKRGMRNGWLWFLPGAESDGAKVSPEGAEDTEDTALRKPIPSAPSAISSAVPAVSEDF